MLGQKSVKGDLLSSCSLSMSIVSFIALQCQFPDCNMTWSRDKWLTREYSGKEKLFGERNATFSLLVRICCKRETFRNKDNWLSQGKLYLVIIDYYGVTVSTDAPHALIIPKMLHNRKISVGSAILIHGTLLIIIYVSKKIVTSYSKAPGLEPNTSLAICTQ